MSRSIQVLYFASLREQLGIDGESLQLPDSITDIRSLREWMCQRGQSWAERFDHEQKLMAAVNQTMARPETMIADGDEVAFFPPVTGG